MTKDDMFSNATKEWLAERLKSLREVEEEDPYGNPGRRNLMQTLSAELRHRLRIRAVT